MPIIFITGVSGSGKTTIGRLLSEQTSLPFFDGDDFHSPANVAKMQSGTPLTDEDRMSWLKAIHDKALEMLSAGDGGAIFACSALKKIYRDILGKDIAAEAHFVLLDGSYDLISQRLQARKGHYMPPALLQSQFDILEHSDDVLKVDLENSPEEMVNIIMDHLSPKPIITAENNQPETTDQQTREKKTRINKNTMSNTKEFGLIGLGVMGKSLSRNLASRGFRLSLFNRHVPGKEENVAVHFLAEFPQELNNAAGFDDLHTFVQSLETPRKIFLMVNAGAPTDAIIRELTPLLSEGDILIDGGNAHYKDTQRRMDELAQKGLHFIGSGVSGGEEGALKGPSIMPGGNRDAYHLIAPYLESIAAKDKNGRSCCAYTGNGGAGHFVKMVHNGIEYAEMQLLAECYFIMRRCMGFGPDQIANAFEQWRSTDATSYLLEITIDILRKRDGNGWLLDNILDVASNKGTGGWATIAAAELGVPATMISEALFARYLSAFVHERQQAEQVYPFEGAIDPMITSSMLRDAYQTARIVNHHQGIHLISAASEAYNWDLQLPEIARIWTNGCIIRSALMEDLVAVLVQTDRILLHPDIAVVVTNGRLWLSRVTSIALDAGLAIPCFSAALNFLNGYSEVDSPMNLIQGQRDYFGAHTYQRKDDPGGAAHHTKWV